MPLREFDEDIYFIIENQFHQRTAIVINFIGIDYYERIYERIARQIKIFNNFCKKILKKLFEKMKDKEDSCETTEIQKFKSKHIPAHHHIPKYGLKNCKAPKRVQKHYRISQPISKKFNSSKRISTHFKASQRIRTQ